MRTTTITSTLTQLTRMRFVNAFLVREDDGFTLVDTTTGGAADDLIAAATALGGDIRRVAMTHGHGDHIGSADAIKERLGDAVEVLVPEADVRRVRAVDMDALRAHIADEQKEEQKQEQKKETPPAP